MKTVLHVSLVLSMRFILSATNGLILISCRTLLFMGSYPLTEPATTGTIWKPVLLSDWTVLKLRVWLTSTRSQNISSWSVSLLQRSKRMLLWSSSTSSWWGITITFKCLQTPTLSFQVRFFFLIAILILSLYSIAKVVSESQMWWVKYSPCRDPTSRTMQPRAGWWSAS